MNDREWIEGVLAGDNGPRAPYNFMFTPPVIKLLQEHYRCEDLDEALGLPLRCGGCKSIKPLYADPGEYGDVLFDEFGVGWTTSALDRGSPEVAALKEGTLKGFEWPDPGSAWRYEDLQEWCAQQAGHFRVLWVGDLWERATFMRGMEGILYDVAGNRGFVEELLDGIMRYILATLDVLIERFEFEAVAVSDDYGAQRGMLMSPADWRELVGPRLRQIYGKAKGAGKVVLHHSCGSIEPIIGDMIEMGLDILHPIQPEAMDIFGLKEKFGKDVTFCGGMCTQRVLPDGSVQEVRELTRETIKKMSRGGRYIFEPGITVQADVPLANVVAMIEEARGG